MAWRGESQKGEERIKEETDEGSADSPWPTHDSDEGEVEGRRKREGYLQEKRHLGVKERLN